jgi:hypothetical protein
VRVPRAAEVEAKSIGSLQLFLRLVVFTYIIVYVMVLQKGYCSFVPVTGSSVLSVRSPSSDVLTALMTDVPRYCCNRSDEGCRLQGQQAAPARRPCWYIDEKLAAVSSDSEVILATRLAHAAQVSSCPTPDSSSCTASWMSLPVPPPTPLPNFDSDSYVAWIENFTLAISHSFSIKSAGSSGKLMHFLAKDMKGVLLDSLSNPVDVCLAGFPSPALCAASRSSLGNSSNSAADVVTLGTILRAARPVLNLDSACHLTGDGAQHEPCFDSFGNDISSSSTRDTGAQLILNIVYSNTCRTGSFCIISSELHDSGIEYEASVTWLTGRGFSQVDGQLGYDPYTKNQRILTTLAGVHIVVSQSGGLLVPDVSVAGMPCICDRLSFSFIFRFDLLDHQINLFFLKLIWVDLFFCSFKLDGFFRPFGCSICGMYTFSCVGRRSLFSAAKVITVTVDAVLPAVQRFLKRRNGGNAASLQKFELETNLLAKNR